jgi:L-alanine-DL-glutamate epimerase-like enolase superfamily enzyme
MFAASLQFIAAIPNCSFFEFCVGTSPLVRDLVDPATFELKDGYVDIPTEPGLGITINEDIMDRYRME